MTVFLGPSGRANDQKGLRLKLTVPKWVCRSPLAHFQAAPTLFKRPPPILAIFGRASGQILKKLGLLVSLGLVTLVHPCQKVFQMGISMTL